MDTYKAVKTQYDELKLRLLELETVKEQARLVWRDAEYDDKESYKEWSDADKNSENMRKSVKAVAYKLIVLEHKELGTSMSKLFREYGVSTLTIKKLLKEAGVAYLRPTLVRWFPIGTAPRDGTRFLSSIGVGGCMPEIEVVLYNVENNEWRTYAYDPPNIEESWMTHWMPLPEPPVLEEKKDD